MLLSVYTHFYQDDQFLDECVQSVLHQTFQEFEFLILIDGNPAAAHRVQSKYQDSRIRFLALPDRRGLTESRALGLRQAKGQYLALIDADDVCDLNRFEKQLSFLQNNREFNLTGSAIQFIDHQSHRIGLRRYPTSDEKIKNTLPIYNCIAQSTVMMKTKDALKVGGYLKRFEWAEDYDLWLRMGKLGKFHNHREPLVKYRIHPAAGKAERTRLALKDTLRLRWASIQEYGYRPSLYFYFTWFGQAFLLLFPSTWIYWLFTQLFIRNSSREISKS